MCEGQSMSSAPRVRECSAAARAMGLAAVAVAAVREVADIGLAGLGGGGRRRRSVAAAGSAAGGSAVGGCLG